MKEKNRLNQLFDQARSEKPIVDQSNIIDLIKSGKHVSATKIKLGKPGRGLFNPQNLIIMISTIAIISILFIVFNGKPVESINQETPGIHIYEYPEVSQNDETEKDRIVNIKEEKDEQPNQKAEELQLISPEIKPIKLEEDVIHKDTIIRCQVLHLNKEELARIGFEFDENGYYYLNELPDKSKINLWSYSEKGKGSSVGFGRGSYVNPVISKVPTNKDYYPVCTSDLDGDDIRVMQGMPEDFTDNFEYYNNTLVPIVLSWSELGGRMNRSFLAWFRPSDNFFSDLSISASNRVYERYRDIHHNIVEKKKGFSVIFDYSLSQLDIGNAITLNPSMFPSLGFSLTSDSLVYQYGTSPLGVEFWFTSFGRGLQALGGPLVVSDIDDEKKALLCAITNIQMNMSMNINPQAYYNVDSTINGDNWIDICVPVRFTEESGELWEGSTFWFYPDENLFSKLPDSIGVPMRAEYQKNVLPKLRATNKDIVPIIIGVRAPDKKKKTEPNEAVPCEYFPSFCEGLPGLDDLNVYPNPATDQINVELTISRAKSINMRVFDISGRLMIDEVETQNYEDAGMYRQQIDLTDLEIGFYLLVLTDDEGAKMTKRIIKN